MGILKRVLFASGPVMRVLTGVGAIALLVAGLKKSRGRKEDTAGIHNRGSSEPLNKQ
jgi:hypothetical protein